MSQGYVSLMFIHSFTYMYFIGTIMHPQLSNFYYSRNVKITIISNMVQQIKLVFFFC